MLNYLKFPILLLIVLLHTSVSCGDIRGIDYIDICNAVADSTNFSHIYDLNNESNDTD